MENDYGYVAGQTFASRAGDQNEGAVINERVSSFLGRPLEGDWPCVWLDATYLSSARGAGSSRWW